MQQAGGQEPRLLPTSSLKGQVPAYGPHGTLTGRDAVWVDSDLVDSLKLSIEATT